jgi:ribonuclease P protein component
VQASFVSPLPGDTPFPQVGYAISKRCGNAVTRNRLRRRLRAVVREATNEGLPAGSYLIGTQPAAAALDYGTLAAHVTEALHRAATAGTAQSERQR